MFQLAGVSISGRILKGSISCHSKTGSSLIQKIIWLERINILIVGVIFWSSESVESVSVIVCYYYICYCVDYEFGSSPVCRV